MSADFSEQSDNINVDVTIHGSYGEVRSKALSAIKADNAPAVIQMSNPTALNRDSGVFVKPNELLPQSHLDEFFEPSKGAYTAAGTLQATPFNTSSPIMYVNQDIYKEAGLDPESPPKTWQKVKEHSREIVNNDIADFGITWPNVVWMLDNQVAQQEEYQFDHKNGREENPTEWFGLSEPVVSYHEYWKEIEEEGLFFDSGKGGWSEAKQAFSNEQAALMIISTAGIQEVTESVDFDMRTAYIPVRDQRYGVVMGGATLSVPKQVSDEKIEAAAEFAQWMTSTEAQATWHKNTGYFPVRNDTVELLEEEGWFEENPNFQVAFDQFMESNKSPITAGPMLGPEAKVNDSRQEAYVRMKQGTEVKESLTQAKQTADETLKGYKEQAE